jgi:hypothetical protein
MTGKAIVCATVKKNRRQDRRRYQTRGWQTTKSDRPPHGYNWLPVGRTGLCAAAFLRST